MAKEYYSESGLNNVSGGGQALGVFQVINSSEETVISPDGTTWLRTGSIEPDVTKYPEALVNQELYKDPVQPTTGSVNARHVAAVVTGDKLWYQSQYSNAISEYSSVTGIATGRFIPYGNQLQADYLATLGVSNDGSTLYVFSTQTGTSSTYDYVAKYNADTLAYEGSEDVWGNTGKPASIFQDPTYGGIYVLGLYSTSTRVYQYNNGTRKNLQYLSRGKLFTVSNAGSLFTSQGKIYSAFASGSVIFYTEYDSTTTEGVLTPIKTWKRTKVYFTGDNHVSGVPFSDKLVAMRATSAGEIEYYKIGDVVGTTQHATHAELYQDYYVSVATG